MKKNTLQEELNKWKDEFPNFYKFALDVKTLKDGDYKSATFDKNSTSLYNKYMTVKNGEIVALGENYPREGGWYWFLK